MTGRHDATLLDRLGDEYTRVRRMTEGLAAPLSPEDMQLQSMPDASPTKWHLAHTTWFFEVFALEPAGVAPFDPAFNHLFNSYYEALGERHARPERGMLSRPSSSEVMRYRAHVDAKMVERIAAIRREGDLRAAKVVELGLHHEEQHQELLLTDALHALSKNPLHPAYRKGEPRGRVSEATPLGFVAYEGGLTRIGHAGDGFFFDNEAPEHTVFVPEFELGDRLVTNGEYAAFIDDGGYERPDLWLSEGYGLLKSEGWSAPLYWERRDKDSSTFSLEGSRSLDPAAPVCHVSYFEADAFARWSHARLPTEFEWELAARQVPVRGNLLESRALMTRAADAAPSGPPRQLFGDAWEWTASAYAPYPGFRALEGALGEYNAKFMVNQMVLRGGSCATSASHIRATYRNFFPPRARWQFSGIRLARD